MHGSMDTYKSEPFKFWLDFKALYSAWGLPFNDVTPDERTELSLTTTQPTDGLSLVFPRLILAKFCQSDYWDASPIIVFT